MIIMLQFTILNVNPYFNPLSAGNASLNVHAIAYKGLSVSWWVILKVKLEESLAMIIIS